MEDDLANFNLIGMLCGLAIYNNVIIDVSFPTVLYHKLMQRYVTVLFLNLVWMELKVIIVVFAWDSARLHYQFYWFAVCASRQLCR